MVALRSLDPEPAWMCEPELIRERRDMERDARLQAVEDDEHRDKQRPGMGSDGEET